MFSFGRMERKEERGEEKELLELEGVPPQIARARAATNFRSPDYSFMAQETLGMPPMRQQERAAMGAVGRDLFRSAYEPQQQPMIFSAGYGQQNYGQPIYEESHHHHEEFQQQNGQPRHREENGRRQEHRNEHRI